MILYKLEFKIDLKNKDHSKIKDKITKAIKEVLDSFNVDVSQKFQWFGHDYSFEAEFTENKSQEILSIFRKYGTILCYCLLEHYITDEEIEVEQHLKNK
jgi:hypothetical protein